MKSFTKNSNSVSIKLPGKDEMTIFQNKYPAVYNDVNRVYLEVDGELIFLKPSEDIEFDGVTFSGTLDQLKDAVVSTFPNANSGSGGSGGATIENVTYAQLVSKINASQLTVGQQYLITDFATKHFIVDANGTQYLDSIITGVTEGLIVTAVAVNKISSEAKSILYPQDKIYYDWNPSNWLNDLSFADLTTDSENPAIVTGFKGVIYFRHDTLLDNYTGYDFRNCKFRRWKTNIDAWDSETSFSKGDYKLYSNKIYKSIKDSNLNNQPNSNPNYWIELINLSFSEYCNNNPTNQNDIASDADQFEDFKTFSEGIGTATYNLCCKSNHFDSFKDDKTDNDSSGTLLSNWVIFLQDNQYYQCYSNTVAAESYGNTVLNNFNNNIIGSYFNGNIIGDSFRKNNIGNNFIGNTIGQNFIGNTILNNCGSNSIGVSVNDNAISNNFSSNDISNNFQINTIGQYFNNNIVATGANNNDIASGFAHNIIGASFNDNEIQADFNSNILADNFRNNKIGRGIDSIDFTSATHVYTTYEKIIFKRQDGTIKLSYYDNSDVQQIVDANA